MDSTGIVRSSCLGQRVAESLHDALGRRLSGEIRDGVEADEVDAALYPAEQPGKAGRVARGIVKSVEHRVFETHPALTGEIGLADEPDHLRYRIGLLNGHNG